MFCRNCGKQMNQSQAMCLSCGVNKGQGTGFCINCAAPVQPGATICKNCGIKVGKLKDLSLAKPVFCKNCGSGMMSVQDVCLKCGSAANTGTAHCGACGKPVNENQAMCLNCGANIQKGINFSGGAGAVGDMMGNAMNMLKNTAGGASTQSSKFDLFTHIALGVLFISLLLPYIGISMMGISISFNFLTLGFQGENIVAILIVLIMLAAIIGHYVFAFVPNLKPMASSFGFIFPLVAGGVAVLFNVFMMFDSFGFGAAMSMFGTGVSIFSVLGLGFWLMLIAGLGTVATVLLPKFMK